jgi:transposase
MICWRNGDTITGSPIQADEGMAQRATEARRIGVGGISQVARVAGVTRKTIRKGLGELEAGALYQPGERIRQQGGGRKKSTVKDATLRADLEEMLEPKGDPESLVKWTSKSVSKLREALTRQGHTIGETAIRRMLHEMGFSLKANKKSIEGASHADRDAQFQHINRTDKAFEAKLYRYFLGNGSAHIQTHAANATPPAITNRWKTSWKPNTLGNGSGLFCA